MRINEVVYFVQDIAEASFIVLEKSGNAPNYLFIALGFVLVGYWVKRQINYNKQAEQTGGVQ